MKRSVKISLFLTCFAVTALFASFASAHLMPAGRGTINLIETKAYLVISLPVAAFDFDSESVSGLSRTDLKKNELKIKDQLRKRLKITSETDIATFDKILINLPTGEGHDGKYDEDLVVMIVAQFETAPQSMTLHCGFWTDKVNALTIKTTESEGRKTLRSEVGELSRTKPDYVFFATPMQVAADTFRNGFTHRVFGFDHLFFVALLLLFAINRTRWSLLIATLAASFAVAFALTTQTAFNIPIVAIEIAIAASVLVVAVAYIRRDYPLAIEIPIVGLLGLLHGLGFAATVFQNDLLTHHGALKMFGFYAGANVGMLAIAAVVLAIIAACQLGSGKPDQAKRFIGTYVMAVVGGLIATIWIIERAVSISIIS